MKHTRRICRDLAFAGAASLTIAFGSRAADSQAPLGFSIAGAVQEMSEPHEAKPYGVPDSYSWQAGPRIENGNVPPAGFRAITGWGQIFRADGTAPISLNVSIRNLKTYLLLSSGELQLVQSSRGIDGAQFYPDYRNNANSTASIASDADGNPMVVTDPFAAFHFWPSAGRAALDPRTVRGVVVAVEAKIDAQNGQTDADVTRRLILSVGADYWLTQNAAWDNYRTNVGAGMGRFDYITTEWKCFTMTTVGASDEWMLPPTILC